MAQGISLVLLGLIATTSIAWPGKENHRIHWNIMVHLQGCIGFTFCIWGIYSIIYHNILGIDHSQSGQLNNIAGMAGNIMQVVIGYLLGYGMISLYVFSKSYETRQKGEERLIKIALLQGKAGIAGISIGILSILLRVFV